MKVYCTLCCKEKTIEKHQVNAIDRYVSDRIRMIYELSKKDKTEFRIFSGKFGLLKSGDSIPSYDFQLFSKDIEDKVKIVSNQLLRERINQIVFFIRDPNLYPDWKPYIKLLKQSCSLSGTELVVRMIGEDFK
jgi:hypothetical protein